MIEMQKKIVNFAPMISIDRHISRLIASNDCVIVPGFGAFLSHRIPAHYNAEEQIFMPPRRTLCFNAQITMDDALLTTAYMQQYGISYKQAAILMKDDIKKLKKRLSAKGRLYFGELGTLSMNIDGVISFEPAENAIDDPDNYGMMPLPFAMLAHKEEPTITIKINRHRISQYVAAAAAIIIMFIFVTPLSDHTFKNDTKASLGSFASPEQISMMQQVGAQAPAAPAKSICEICPIEESVKSAPAAVEPVEAEAVAEPAEIAVVAPVAAPAEEKIEKTDKYHIIVASSPTEDNANLAIKELEAKAEYGYSKVAGNGRFRISAGAYDTHEAAQAALAGIQTTFPDAWILKCQ